MVDLANTVWRNFVTDGVPSSGVNDVDKAKARAWGTWLESLVSAGALGDNWKATKALLDADLDHAADSIGVVYNDSTPANNGTYVKSGASGAGSWTQLTNFLPGYQVVSTSDDSSTANAITMTASPYAPTDDGAALIFGFIPVTNTDTTVTISFDGGPTYALKTAAGNNPAIGTLVAGMPFIGQVSGSGTTFRLVSDISSSAVQAACEAAADRAEAAAASVAFRSAATRTAMKAFDTAEVTFVYLTESGREGAFKWDSSDLSTEVAADTAEGIYVSSGDGSAGAWVRVWAGGYMASWFGLAAGNSAATNDTAMEAAIVAADGKSLIVGDGLYAVTGGYDLSGKNDTRIWGLGSGVTEFDVQHATNDLFYVDVSSADTTGLDVGNFSVKSTTTRTAGWVFHVYGTYSSAYYFRRSKIHEIKWTKQLNGIAIKKYEFVDLINVFGDEWVGTSGRGVQCGQTTSTDVNQGSEIRLINVQINGNDGSGTINPTLGYGLWIEDTDAVYTKDGTHFLNSKTNNVVVKGNTGGHSVNNIFFDGLVADGTEDSDCIKFQGDGSIVNVFFSGAWWVASAGKLGTGAAEAVGINIDSGPSYNSISLTGGILFNNSGSGLYDQAQDSGLSMTGVDVRANGNDATTNTPGVFISPASAATIGRLITGCRFSEQDGVDIQMQSNANLDVITGNSCPSGISHAGTPKKVSGNGTSQSTTIASTTTLPVIPAEDYYVVTGTNNFHSLQATWPGHLVTLKFDAALSAIDATGNCKLAGNFTTAAGSTLSMRCDGTNWWEVSRINT